jgi:predicted esterase
MPRIFISHGRADPILPVAAARGIAQSLGRTGYDVAYEEFNGGHEVPPSLLRRAFERLAS